MTGACDFAVCGSRLVRHTTVRGLGAIVYLFLLTTALNTWVVLYGGQLSRKIGYKALLQSYSWLGRLEIRRSLYLFMVSPKLRPPMRRDNLSMRK
jgi:hypothetical protein